MKCRKKPTSICVGRHLVAITNDVPPHGKLRMTDIPHSQPAKTMVARVDTTETRSSERIAFMPVENISGSVDQLQSDPRRSKANP